jgi:hypothetical protein
MYTGVRYGPCFPGSGVQRQRHRAVLEAVKLAYRRLNNIGEETAEILSQDRNMHYASAHAESRGTPGY